MATTGSATFAHGDPIWTDKVMTPAGSVALGNDTGCSTGFGNDNFSAEPAIRVAKDGTVALSSEESLGSGTDVWIGSAPGGSGASACTLTYAGEPNAVLGAGAAGGDTDVAVAPVRDSSGRYRIYVASLNLGSVAVAHSDDGGRSFVNVPVQAGLPGDDREWIAAVGADTSLLTFHDVVTDNIDVLRSDTGGAGYVQIARAIPDTDYKARNNELGNIAIDHATTTGVTANAAGLPAFWAYQVFVAPSTSAGATNNEAFVAASHDGGFNWALIPVPCSVNSGGSLDHNFPNVSVDPAGDIWVAWSNDTNVFAAESTNHGATWKCSTRVSTNTAHAIFPWLSAASGGVDLVYYGQPSGSNKWYAYFAQRVSGTWQTPTRVSSTAVHTGPVCEAGFPTCSANRQLFDDFGVDVDPTGWAHVAYSHDAPCSQGDTSGACSATGYAVQTGGAQVGAPN